MKIIFVFYWNMVSPFFILVCFLKHGDFICFVLFFFGYLCLKCNRFYKYIVNYSSIENFLLTLFAVFSFSQVAKQESEKQ